MANDISGFGLRIQVVASETFGSGFDVTQFSDDGDPFDIPSIQIRDKAMGLNGDLITWSKANPINITLNVIPGSDDDKNLAVLLEANRVGKGKNAVRDRVTMTGIYPDGSSITLNEGKITDGMPGTAVASSGRQKTKAYQFTFENLTRNEASNG